MTTATLYSAFLLSLYFHRSCCSISVIPSADQLLPLNSPSNVTFTCNVSMDSVQRRAIWEVDGLQIQSGENLVRTSFETIGIFIEPLSEDEGVVNLVVTQSAREQYQDSGLMVRCTAFTPGEPPITELGQVLYVRVYGRPEPPGNLRLLPLKPTYLVWDRPANLPSEVAVTYNVSIGSSTREPLNVLNNQTRFSIQPLEKELANQECRLFTFSVVASVLDAEDSMAATIMDTIPLSTNVSSIDETLRVNSVMFASGSIVAKVSFMAVVPCNSNFTIRNYTAVIDGTPGPTELPTLPVTIFMISLMERDRVLEVGVLACNDIACRNSITVPLYTSDVQSAQVLFFENNVFLTCMFAGGSTAVGCVFEFQVSQNGTDEIFVLLQSSGGQQCNVTVNQINGYMGVSVFDLEADGVSLSRVPIVVDTVVVTSEAEFTNESGCMFPPEDVVTVTVPVPDSKAVSIAVPIVVVLVLITVLVIIVVILLAYRRIQKKKPKLTESDSPDTLFLDIASDNHKMLLKPSPSRSKTLPVLQSLPPTSRPTMSLPPQRSLNLYSDHSLPTFSVPPERAAPIEVELHRNSIKIKVNKTALRAMAYMTKSHAQANEESSQSLISMSRVHVSDEFKSICCDLPPVEEGGEEEEELKSWGIINTPPQMSSM